MYPNLYYAFKDWFGVEWKALYFLNTFGLMVAMGFVAAAIVLSKELQRREKLGLLHPRKNGQLGVLIQSAGRDANDRYTMGSVSVLAYDSDADAMPDSWEQQQFGSLTNGPGGDVDGDGMGNREEWIAGTEPTNSLSAFRALEISEVPVSGAGKVISWASASGRVYDVLSAASLIPQSFAVQASGLAATPPHNAWTSGSAQATAFFQIMVTHP